MSRTRFAVILAWSFLFVFLTWLPFAESRAAEREKICSCLLDRSNIMNVIIETDDSGTRQVVLEKQHFLLSAPQILATLHSPMMVSHGGVQMFLDDRGKEGYFFLRIQPSITSPGELEGLMDNHLTVGSSGYFTGGQLKRMFCARP